MPATGLPAAAQAAGTASSAPTVQEQHGHLPVDQMQKALQAEGTASKGVLA